MINKTIRYKDLDGEEHAENHYFHIQAKTIVAMEVEHKEGMQEYVRKLMESNDRKEIMRIFVDLIDMSYGIRNEEGGFEQTPEILAKFRANVLLYDALFSELMTSPEAALEFLQGIMPRAVQEEIDKAGGISAIAAQVPAQEEPAWIRENRKPTNAELKAMSTEELREAMRRQSSRELQAL